MATLVADYCSGLAVQFLYEQMPTIQQTTSFVEVIKDIVTREAVEEETSGIDDSHSERIKSSFFTKLGTIWHREEEAVNIIKKALSNDEAPHNAQGKSRAAGNLVISNNRNKEISCNKVCTAKEPLSSILLVLPDIRSERHADENRSQPSTAYYENMMIDKDEYNRIVDLVDAAREAHGDIVDSLTQTYRKRNWRRLHPIFKMRKTIDGKQYIPADKSAQASHQQERRDDTLGAAHQGEQGPQNGSCQFDYSSISYSDQEENLNESDHRIEAATSSCRRQTDKSLKRK
ncbi:unnamed protein product [Amoebophrya sp. A25]|nr:unnamed protein product [Amoebophrya sp. A25]|eukprot:GSA25T00005853001.1